MKKLSFFLFMFFSLFMGCSDEADFKLDEEYVDSISKSQNESLNVRSDDEESLSARIHSMLKDGISDSEDLQVWIITDAGELSDAWDFSEIVEKQPIEYVYKFKGPDKPKIDCCEVELMPSFTSTNTLLDDGWSLDFTISERGLQWQNDKIQFIRWDIDYIDNGTQVDFWEGERPSFAAYFEVSCKNPIGTYGTGLAWTSAQALGTYPVNVDKGFYLLDSNGNVVATYICDSDSGTELLVN